MADLTLEDLQAYLDEALNEADTARVEKALRENVSLRQALRGVMMERDRGEHSVGAIWRRNRLSCATREELGSYVLGIVEEGLQDFIRFHLETIGCPYCHANLVDLQNRQREPVATTQKRRKKLFQTSAGLLRPGKQR